MATMLERLDAVEKNQQTLNADIFNEDVAQMKPQEAEFDLGIGSLTTLKPKRADLPLVTAAFGAASANGLGKLLVSHIPADWQWTQNGNVLLGPQQIAQLATGWLIYRYGSKFAGKYGNLVSSIGGGVVIETIKQILIAGGWYFKKASPAQIPALNTDFNQPEIANDTMTNETAGTNVRYDAATRRMIAQ